MSFFDVAPAILIPTFEVDIRTVVYSFSEGIGIG